jgi:hypothetical protein
MEVMQDDRTFSVNFRDNGISNVDTSLTINGITKTPTLAYIGGQANPDGWPAYRGHGEILSLAGSGANPTYNNGSPCLGFRDDSVKFNTGKYFLGSSTTVGDVTGEDVVSALLFRYGGTAQGWAGKRTTAPLRGWLWYATSTSGQIRFYIYDDAGSNFVGTAGAELVEGVTYLAMAFVNRSEASANGAVIYINAVSEGVADMSGGTDATCVQAMFLGATETGTLQADDNLLGFWQWQQDDWHQEGAAGPAEWSTVAQEFFYKIAGVYPQIARGTAIPNVVSRDDAAYIDKYNPGTGEIELYRVGANWPRLCRRRDENGDVFSGYLSEQTSTQELLQSDNYNTSWTVRGSASVTSNDAASPEPGTLADKFEDIGARAADDIYQNVAGLTNDGEIAIGVWVKRISTSNTLNLVNGIGGESDGHWTIDLSALPDRWVRLTRDSTYITVVNEFVADSSGNCGLWFYATGGSIDFHCWNSQLEDNGTYYVSSDIVSTTIATERVKDQLQYQGDDGNLGGVGSNKEGTIGCDILLPNKSSADVHALFDLTDGGSSGERIAVFTSTGGAPDVWVRAQSSTEVNISDPVTDVTDNVKHSVKLTWRPNSCRLVMDGAEDGTPDTDCDFPDDLDEIHVGENFTSGQQLNGLISNLSIWGSQRKLTVTE